MKSCCPTRAEILLLVVGLGLLGPAGCGSRVRAIVPPGIASDAAKRAIETYDLDKNGYLDAGELEKAPAIRAAFPDSNKVTEEDIAARIASWKEAKVGRVPFIVAVLHNGQPLPGATVSLVPESFLGSELETAVGTTDQSGRTMPTVPAHGSDNLPGVAPGFYRVEVTKAGETIPAKYNTATTLGGEVPQMDAKRWVLDLKY
ncbi:MAG: carboxypeptidase-like regulatory domain-containing protein [Thermoguttaceae bacterium]|jgi:hypothetical protein